MEWKVDSKSSAAVRASLWNACLEHARSCSACELSMTRGRVVFGEGDCTSKLMFIGEGPGAEEDETGRPFVGQAGSLLSQILKAAGIDRNEVYITNIVKCRPPKNRVPKPEEAAACAAILQAQLLLVDPSILVLLGGSAVKYLLNTAEGITKLRGRWIDWKGINVMPMFHPSYLLRYPNDKTATGPKNLTWLDIQEVKKKWDEVRSIG